MSAALRERAIELAIAEIGRGELTGKNNRGPDVDRYRAGARVGGIGGDDPWCAAFVSYCYRRAAAELQLTLPFRTGAGAKRLVRAIGECEAGSFIDPRLITTGIAPIGGSLVCWNRGLNPWAGHIGFVVGYDGDGDTLVTVEGNHTPKVDRFTYPNGVWRKRLYRMAALG